MYEVHKNPERNNQDRFLLKEEKTGSFE